MAFKILQKKYFTKSARSYFMGNLNMLLSSGLDVQTALQTIGTETKNKNLQEVILKANQRINDGEGIADSFAESNLLPQASIELISLGERYGLLGEIITIISQQYESELEFRRQLRSALMYPVFVIGLGTVAIIVILNFVLPRVSRVFSQLTLDLPAITRFVIDLGLFLENYGTLASLILGSSAVLFIFFFFIFPRTKIAGDWLVLHIPVLKILVRQIELARLGTNMHLILKSGATVTDALKTMENIAQLTIYKRFYHKLNYLIENGYSFSDAFNEIKNTDLLMNYAIRQVIVSGEAAGLLPEAFGKMGENLHKQIQITAKNFTRMLEPMLIVLIWAVIITIAIAVILPIYGLLGELQGAVNPNI